jgi:cytochrome c oxidase subunit 3
MGSTVTTAQSEGKTWDGGNEPLGASWKINDVVFIVSDALTFSQFFLLTVF